MLPRRIPKEPKRSTRWRSQLCSLLEYEDGKLIWRARPPEMFPDQRSHRAWNTRFAGKEAFTAKHSEGYRVGRIEGRTLFAHRVIWEMHCGSADGEIDHINGDRSDNRLENLRLVTHADNGRNVKCPATNTSGVVGVRKVRNRWQATIQHQGKSHYIGTFASLAEAASSRKAKEAELGFHPNHGRAG